MLEYGYKLNDIYYCKMILYDFQQKIKYKLNK